jgi:hypothetical protein
MTEAGPEASEDTTPQEKEAGRSWMREDRFTPSGPARRLQNWLVGYGVAEPAWRTQDSKTSGSGEWVNWPI